MDNFENNNSNEINQESKVEQSSQSAEEKKVQYYADGQFSDERGKIGNTVNKKKMPSWAKALIIIGAIIVCIVMLTVACNKTIDNVKSEIYGGTSSNEVTANFGHDYIGEIHIEDSIDEYSTGLYNHKYLLNAIDAMMKDDNNKGIIMYINTPGGSVYASDELYLKIKEYQETTKRPVYSAMQSQATSGGYYISASCDKIIANRNCWTGSIGVTMGTLMDLSELLENLGIKTQTITSGANKAMGSSYEPMTAEQREIFQSLIDDAYEQFVGIVAEGRDMDVKDVKKLADGRIYTAKQALENGLIDQIGTFEEAVDDMRKTYNLGDCVVEDFYSEAETSIYSLLGLLSEKKGASSSVLTEKEAIEELIALDGTFRVSYMSEIQK